MSRLKVETPDQAQLTVERLYKDLERHIIASPPGLCPVDLQLSFLKVCHAQTCGKSTPCRIGLGQLQKLMESVLEGKATMKTLQLIEDTANNIMDSADCAIGYEAAHMVLAGLVGFKEDYIHHIKTGKCNSTVNHSVPCVALCPAQVDIPGYIALVGEGRYADAIKLIRKDNPFPTACALICEHPCEARCRRNMIDAAINIRGLKRMAVDNAPANTVPVPEKAESQSPDPAEQPFATVNLYAHARGYEQVESENRFNASLAMTSPLNLPAPGRCQAIYLIFRFCIALCFC